MEIKTKFNVEDTVYCIYTKGRLNVEKVKIESIIVKKEGVFYRGYLCGSNYYNHDEYKQEYTFRTIEEAYTYIKENIKEFV